MKWIYVRRCDSPVNLADPSSNKARVWVIFVKENPAFRSMDTTSIRAKLCADSTHVLDQCHWGHQRDVSGFSLINLIWYWQHEQPFSSLWRIGVISSQMFVAKSVAWQLLLLLVWWDSTVHYPLHLHFHPHLGRLLLRGRIEYVKTSIS